MFAELPYGKNKISVAIPARQVEQIRPGFVAGLVDEEAGFQAAARNPIGAAPLRELISPRDRVAIVIPDITRALPSERLLTWLFQALQDIPRENFTIIIGTGTHRPNTPDEIISMVGARIASQYHVINHSAFDPETLTPIGTREQGLPILMNSTFVKADKRIIMGFIEPHFMAGFSGGYKAIFPGIADLASIMHYHRAAVIGDPLSTWGNLNHNPTQDQVRRNGSQIRVDFCINVTLNNLGQITAYFCGDVIAAHDQGCAFAKATAMVKSDREYPIVITSNAGYPLDQNLYQAVKGMSAAAQIVAPGGVIIIAARCNDGFPEHGNFRRLLLEYDSPQAFLKALNAPGFQVQDQWQNQLLALIQLRARVAVFCELDPDELRKVHLEPITDLNAFVANEISRLGDDACVAVLPEGPMTIPYLD
ncbi:MAG: nickel-dependent lactate racemase [Pseudomonadales bacterium]|nr:nickel-dependent lactate racemase [Pseudomonadales bacterium]